MAKPELIVMLTWNDKTVADAKEIFLAAKDAPAKYWGCKREGISEEALCDLLETMKANGKETFLETISIDEQECLETAEIAAKCGADHLIGTIYFDSVYEVCKKANMTYSPFFGLDPVDTRLRGTVDEIVKAAVELEKKDVWGTSFSGFRYISGDPVELVHAVCAAVKKPITIMGSVNSYERLDVLKEVPNLFAFTIGGAFFEKKFGETFAEQITVVHDYLNK